MKQASVLLFLFAFLLLSTTAAQAQLMRKDTATLPRSKWEVGLDLKPIWDRSEPYNFVVRYFFKDRWALRGGMGLEMNWVDDTLSTRVFETIDTTTKHKYGVWKDQETRQSNYDVFLGIQYEHSMKRLRWYAAADVFYFWKKDWYEVPLTVSFTSSDQPILELTNQIIEQVNLQEGGGIRLINGFRYLVISNLSISTEMALTAQRINFNDKILISDSSKLGSGYYLSEYMLGQGWRHNVEIKPFFRLFVNYHF